MKKFAVAMVAAGAMAMGAMTVGAHAQVVVKRIPFDPAAKLPISTGVWAGDTLYISGALATAHTGTGDAAVYGDTEAQATNILTNFQAVLKSQGLDMKDVVKTTVFLVADPAKGNKMDFVGLNTAFNKFFGTADQPNKPARSAVQVAALVRSWGLVEIELIAVRSK
jgi:enamine deaminase RidA (YjgF/YER057c/UK114 family)